MLARLTGLMQLHGQILFRLTGAPLQSNEISAKWARLFSSIIQFNCSEFVNKTYFCKNVKSLYLKI